LVPCDAVSVFVLDSTAERITQSQDLPATTVGTAADADALFFRHYWDSLPCSHFDRTGDLDSVVLLSDYYSLREERRTGMWVEFLSAWGFERELIMCVAGVPGRTLRILLSRTHGRDFSDRDRSVMWLLRPHLYGLYRRHRVALSGRTDVTPRQRGLLNLVAAGQTNRQISRQLGISESTTRKHLENIYARLGVNNRAAAVARVFPDGHL
jgi:DNA-binding CsgD family transcriptional regulator